MPVVVRAAPAEQKPDSDSQEVVTDAWSSDGLDYFADLM